MYKKVQWYKKSPPTLHLYSVTNSKYVFVYWKYNTRLGFKLYFHPRRHQWWWWEWCVSTAIYGSTTDQKKFSKLQKTFKCLKRFFCLYTSGKIYIHIPLTYFLLLMGNYKKTSLSLLHGRNRGWYLWDIL